MARTFRADVEGLRALAVVPILLFHLNTAWCPGGFIGVDIFFVISGYLITRLILAEGPAFSFRAFYLRRFFRLFPALLVTLLGTVVAAWWLASPGQYQGLAKSAVASLFGFSNFYFWTTIDYFSASAFDHPLLHTWSLGVEEQFYLIWPALLVLAHRGSRYFQALIVVVIVASLALIAVFQSEAPEAAFYLMPFRMFEFAIGAGVVAVERDWRPKAGLWTEMGEWASALVIVSCLVALDPKSAWPGLPTLAVAIATGSLIGLGGRGSITKALSCMPLRLIGRISYSLYLVHWPIITLFRAHTIIEPGIWTLVGLGVATVAAAVVLYFLVEKPFRTGHGVTTPALSHAIPTLAGGCVLLLAGSAAVLASAGFPSRVARDRVQFVDNGLTFAGDLCSHRRAECVFGDRNATKTVYLMGDSHALNLVHGLDALFTSRGIKGIALYDHGCLFAKDTRTYVNGVPDPKCARNVANAYAYLAQRRDPIIIAMNYQGYRGTAADALPTGTAPVTADIYLAWLSKRLEAGIVTLNPRQRTIVLVKEAYQTGVDLPKCLSRPGAASVSAVDPCAPTGRREAFSQAAAVDRMIDNLASGLGLVTIDPKQAFCGEDECRTRDGSALYFRDTAHLTNVGSLFLINRLESQLVSAIQAGK